MTNGHTVRIHAADIHVEIWVDGQQIASSDRPTLLDETGLPTRYYLPRADVRTDLLRGTNFNTECPFKGTASYWTLTLGDEVYDGIAWSYETPIDAAKEITGLLCFYPTRAETKVGDEGRLVS
jgi:uncharacterized protein (DUF427 family)